MKKSLFTCLLSIIAITAFAQLNPKDTVRKIVVFFQTSNEILSGTNNDVWFDIGPKAWRVSDGFEKGTVKQFTIDNPSKLSIGASASQEEDVPLLVEDIKLIRIEKKGIRLCDIIPNFDIQLCNEMGGLSNAPDHPLELTTPDIITPIGQVAQLKKNIATANALVFEQQTLLDKGTKEFNELSNKIINLKDKIKNLSTKVSKIPQKAAEVHKQILDLRQKILNIPTKVVKQVCQTVEKKEWKLLGFLLGWGWVVVGTELVCHNEDVVNQAWTDMNQTITNFEKEEVTLAGDAGALALKELTEAQIELSGLKQAKLTIDVQLKVYKSTLSIQRKLLTELHKDLGQLQDFIKNKLPFLSLDFIPKLNQWKLDHVSVFVNGKEFGSYHIHKRFKQENNTWITYLGAQSNAMKFLNALRVNKNNPGKTLDGIMAGITTPFFKEREISGWDNGPIKYATIAGELVNEPNVGTDGFVSLDMKVDTAFIDGKKYILNNKNGINHIRYIRCEYLRVKPSGDVDDNFNGLKIGQKLKISGKVKRDLDRHTYFELHPELSSEVTILN